MTREMGLRHESLEVLCDGSTDFVKSVICMPFILVRIPLKFYDLRTISSADKEIGGLLKTLNTLNRCFVDFSK